MPTPSSPADALRADFAVSHARLQAASRTRMLEDVSALTANRGENRVVNCVDFSSNDYLGLRLDPRLAEGGLDAVRRYGSGSGASRLVAGVDGGAFTLESLVAERTGWGGATFFPSGFLANLAFFDALAPFDFEGNTLGETAGAKRLEVFLDVRAHASLFFGARSSGVAVRPFRHGDTGQLERLLNASTARHKIVVVESLHSMDGNFEDLGALLDVCVRTCALAYIDEAHTFGIVGPAGCGALAALGLDDQKPGGGINGQRKAHVLGVMLGCGKAIGVNGGLLAGPSWLRERVVQKARPLLYSTAQSPFVSGAVRASLAIVFGDEGDALRARLLSNVHALRARLAATRLSVCGDADSPIAGVVVGDEAAALALSLHARECGVLARAIRPPTVPRGTSRLRLVSHATHEPSHWDALCKALTFPD